MIETFYAEAKIARDRAMGKVGRANVDFVNNAIIAIERLAARTSKFIVDDVWVEMDKHGLAAFPTDYRAMGVAMREAAKLGIIRSTGFFRPSAQPQCHANPRRVWESLIHHAG